VLHDRVGSDGDGVAGTGHFRLVYASDDGSVKAFALVPGAVVVGTADPGRSVAVSVPVTVGDRAVTYARETTTTAAGWYAVTVPYPGRYTVDGRPVTVSERDVLAGRFVDADGRSPAPTRARWSFDAGRGDVAFDSHGGAHGRVVGPTWAAEGLDFRGTGGVTIAGVPTPTPETGLALTVRFAAVDSIDPSDPEPTRFPRLVAAAPSGRYTTTDGYQLGLVDGRIVGAVGDGPGAGVVRGPAVDDGRPHVVSLLWDGAVVRLVVDGDVVDAVPYDGPVTRSDTLVVGATTDDRYHLRGVVTDLRLDLAPDGAVRDGTTPAGAQAELPDPHPPLPLSTVSNTEPSYRGV
jgi:dolichyl-diphosphooligosaccharide--protein glycosyltransferase